MVREVVNFSSFWRSSTFSSTVDPTIYLLAFGFGFGSLVTHGRGLRLHRLRRHRDRRHDGAVLGALPRDVLDVRQVRVPAHLRRDPRRAGRHRGAGHRPRRCGSRRARASTAACRCSWRWCFGLDPSWGMLLVPFIAALAGCGWACFGIFIAARAKSIESFSYWQSGLLTPMFLVAGTFFPLSPLPQWAQVLGELQPAVPLRPAGPARRVRPRGLARRGPRGVPGRLRAALLAPGDPLHGAPADPLNGSGAPRTRSSSTTARAAMPARGCTCRRRCSTTW